MRAVVVESVLFDSLSMSQIDLRFGMQNPSGNINQQMYYQQQQGGTMNMGYSSISNQAQSQQQQQMMQNVPQTMTGPPSNLSSSPQVYGTSVQGMTPGRPYSNMGVPQQHEMALRGQMFMSGGGTPYPSSEPPSMAAAQQQPQTQVQQPTQQQQMQQGHTAVPGVSAVGYQRVADSSTDVRREEVRAIKPLNPPPYAPDILNNLDKYSVAVLAIIGRELVQELLFRTYTLMTVLSKAVDRRHQQQGVADAEQLLEYCQLLLSKIVEIRLRIEKSGRPKEIDVDDFIKMMADPSPPFKSPQQIEKEKTFEEKRRKLVRLSSALKRFDWMCNASDPRLLKKLDKL
ncbi:hypothetical protein AB6A40_004750 [Gnathostoma spinigerum]|uniref:Mediator complex subunit 30 n=1 Tax=Gnathostoma spinigerum TaxID=75299 RepID=A0ABD6EKU4_9BILA